MQNSEICDVDKCTGCGACYNKCPRHCIEMQEDELGFLYPVINEAECIHCNLCKKTCPVNEPVVRKEAKKTYAAWDLNQESRKSSMSGGVAAVFSRYIIDHHGVVYGAVWNSDFSVSHVRISNYEDLEKLKGSKYVQSNLADIFKSVEHEVKNEKLVLFTGTPCQCAGLINYLGKQYSNLYVVDIICHGVPSQSLLKDAVKCAIGEQHYTKILFRDNTGYKLKIYNGEDLLYAKSYRESSFARAFLYGLHSRKSCYSCDYANPKRVTDITIGDFWGLGKNKPFNYSTKDGVSAIMVISDKGEELLEKCKEYLFLEERETQEAVHGNSQLMQPHKQHPKYEYFRKHYQKGHYYETLDKCFKTELIFEKIKKQIKIIIGKDKK